MYLFSYLGSQEVDQSHVGEQDLVADVVVALVPVVTVEVEVVADGEGDRTVAADPKIPLLPSAIKSCMTVRNCIFCCCWQWLKCLLYNRITIK